MNSKISILIVEDEAAIRTGLEDVFVYHGYAVESAAEGPDGLHKALSGRFDLILLDLMLPGMDGFEICNRIRAQDPEQPIIMLTAKTGDADIIQGLSLGADDYVAKPFSVAQLVLRVQAVLRRSHIGVASDNQLRLGDQIELDMQNLSGRRGDTVLSFTRREMEILQYLAAKSERPVSREELLAKVWGYAKNRDLILAYQDNVVSVFTSQTSERYLSSADELDGALLLQTRLSAPLTDLELIVNVRQLPAGPGATLIAWVSGVLVLVLGTGIGLALVQQLTLSMNGQVEVVNRSPGAEFRLVFAASDQASV